MTSSGSSSIGDVDWGCEHFDFPSLMKGNIRACRVSVTDITKLAKALIDSVLDTSWMSRLDPGARRSYERTVADTRDLLVAIFNAVTPANPVAEEFGEVMVSMGSARALRMIFGHSEVPLAELWKPQIKQNEGFDFHTVCTKDLLNFGEAKYSSNGSPHGNALSQISSFLAAEKHYRDRPHLVSVAPSAAVDNLFDSEEFGVVAAFSLNAKNKELVIKNAIKSAEDLAKQYKISQIFVVGVSYDA